MALEEYTALLAQRPGIAAALTHYGYDAISGKAKLQKLYHDLVQGDGSFWVGEMFAPALALFSIELLMKLFQADKEKADTLMLAMITNDYFRRTDFVGRLTAARAKGFPVDSFVALQAHILVEERLTLSVST